MTRTIRAWVGAAALCVACSHSVRAPYVRRPVVDPPARDIAESAVPPAPSAGPIDAWAPPSVRTATLSNGVRVQLVERHEYGVVAFTVVSDQGRDAAPTGLGVVFPKALGHATTSRKHEEVERTRARLGARIRIGMTHDFTYVTSEVISPDASTLIGLIAEFIAEPSYATDLDKVRGEAVAAEDAALDRPATLAAYVANLALFPRKHPYHRDLYDLAEEARRVDAERLAAFHARAFAADRTSLVVVGDFQSAPMLVLLEAKFGKAAKKAGAPSAIPEAPPEAKLSDGILLVDSASAEQSTVVFARARPRPPTREEEDALALAAILLRDALQDETRVAHGYTYGVHVSFAHARGPGLVQIETAADRTHTADAIRDVRAVLDRFTTKPPSDEALARAKVQARIDDMLAWEHAADVATLLAEGTILGRPEDEWTNRAARRAPITGADVMNAAKAFLDPSTMRVVVVGDAHALRASLEGLAIGPVELKSRP